MCIMKKKELVFQIIEYIIRHYDEDITVSELADHFHFSQYYFCRTFKEVTGESIYAFIKRLKMDQSAVDIKLDKNKTITDIGLDYGYSSSNYSSAFKKHYHVSPAEFRKSANVTSMLNPFNPEELSSFNTFDYYASRIKIQNQDSVLVIYERMIGNYSDLEEKWFQFIDQYKEHIKSDTLMIERFYQDPSITCLNQCICDLCMTVDESCELDNTATLKGGKFATYRFEGEIKDIFCTLQGVFNVWLPSSGYKMRERYGFNIYRKMERNSPHVIMDLCIPIK